MRIKTYETKEAWENDRIGRITGSKLKDLITKRGTSKKIGFWQLIADKLALPDRGEQSALERGNGLEKTALEKFQHEVKLALNTELVMWLRDDNEFIAISPDAYTEDLKVAVEVKCLSSARHVEALWTKKVPKDFEDQVIQYFVVNDQLEKLYLVFYDDRLLTKQFFYLEVTRESVKEKVAEYLKLEYDMLNEINTIVMSLYEEETKSE
jgi:hypothetical protein